MLQFSVITTNKFRQLTPFSNKRVKAINKFCCSHSTLTIIRRQVQLQTPECNNFSTNLRCSMEGRWMSLMGCLLSGRLSRRRTSTARGKVSSRVITSKDRPIWAWWPPQAPRDRRRYRTSRRSWARRSVRSLPDRSRSTRRRRATQRATRVGAIAWAWGPPRVSSRT